VGEAPSAQPEGVVGCCLQPRTVRGALHLSSARLGARRRLGLVDVSSAPCEGGGQPRVRGLLPQTQEPALGWALPAPEASCLLSMDAVKRPV